MKLGAVMRGATAARVLASKSKQAAPGDYVSAMSGWTEYAILDEGQFEPASSFPGLNANEPQDMLSVLGLTGATAWWGMTQIGDPKPGELVVVSGAAGATGSVAGQIAKIKGATVVGICGSDAKCSWLVNELGFDVALNYKASDFRDQFKAATKSYIDVYFDNGLSTPSLTTPVSSSCLSLTKDQWAATFSTCVWRGPRSTRGLSCAEESASTTRPTPSAPRTLPG